MNDVLSALPEFARANELLYCDNLLSSGQDPEADQKVELVGPDKANLISSKIAGDTHYPLIDIDMDAALIKSSTTGHHHLYIKKAMSYENYIELLEVMVKVGIVQEGVLKAAKKRGYTSLRLPHVKKGQFNSTA